MNKTNVNISFDIEDIYGDQKLLNETLLELLSFCSKNEIPVDLYISAIKYPFLTENKELITLIKKSDFINIGYHSNSHSFYIIAEQNSIDNLKRIEEFHFDIFKEKITETKGGIIDFLSTTKTSMFRCPGYSWTPDYFEFMKSYNMRYTTIDIDYPDLFNFMNLIIIPVMIKPLEKINTEEEIDLSLKDSSYKSLYLHPARLLYNHFWDKMKINTYHIIKERNIYNDYNERINRIKQILLYIKNNYTTFSCNKICFDKIESKEKDIHGFKEKLSSSMTDKWNWSQITKPVDSKYHLTRLEKAFTSLEFGEYCIKDI